MQINVAETGIGEQPPDFELANVGVGPDPLSLGRIADSVTFAVLLFLRDYHCPKCKQQVQRIAEASERFATRDVAVAAILPEPVERARDWQEEFDLPFPLLADPEKEASSSYGQSTRFGALGRMHDLLGRMPKSVVLDVRDEPRILAVHDGDSPGDRPSVDELLAVVDEQQEFVFDCELVDC